MVDSTNAEVPGFTTPERDISPALERVFVRSKQRVIVACFASHVHRVQQVLDAAVTHAARWSTSAARWCATWRSLVTLAI